MEIKLLQNTSNTNSMTRNFRASQSLEGTLKEGSDVLSPNILIYHQNPSAYNMCYIKEFNRYYFVEFENVRNNIWMMKALGVDVLYTYKDFILQLNAIIDKQEKSYNEMLDDGSYLNQVNTFPEVISFSNGFSDDGQFVLITAGA